MLAFSVFVISITVLIQSVLGHRNNKTVIEIIDTLTAHNDFLQDLNDRLIELETSDLEGTRKLVEDFLLNQGNLDFCQEQKDKAFQDTVTDLSKRQAEDHAQLEEVLSTVRLLKVLLDPQPTEGGDYA